MEKLFFTKLPSEGDRTNSKTWEGCLREKLFPNPKTTRHVGRQVS